MEIETYFKYNEIDFEILINMQHKLVLKVIISVIIVKKLLLIKHIDITPTSYLNTIIL